MKVRAGFNSERLRDLSFEEVLNNLGKRQAAVYNMILEFAPVTLEETARLMGVEKNCISGRFTELKDLELIEYAGETWNKERNRKISLWKIKKCNAQLTFQFGNNI